MSRILRRPMFRGGRVAKAGGGLSQLRPGYAPGGEVMDIYSQIEEKIPMPEKRKRQGLTVGDYLRIASSGLEILGAPSEGSGFKGTLATASKPLSKLGVDLGTSIDARDQKIDEDYQQALEDRKGLVTSLTGAQAEFDIGKMKAKGEKEFIVEQINSYWQPLIDAEPDEAKKKELEQQKRADTYNVIVLGEDVSDKYKILNNAEAYEIAADNARAELESMTNKATGNNWTRDDKGYAELLAQLTNKYLRLATKFLQPDLAQKDGGRIGKANGGMMTEDVNVMEQTPTGMADVNVSATEPVPTASTNEINISYDQLRDRLPPEISDDIVLLLSQSYEAFADFAEIQTQADVNEFNIKYNVQLFLPQQSGA